MWNSFFDFLLILQGWSVDAERFSKFHTSTVNAKQSVIRSSSHSTLRLQRASTHHERTQSTQKVLSKLALSNDFFSRIFSGNVACNGQWWYLHSIHYCCRDLWWRVLIYWLGDNHWCWRWLRLRWLQRCYVLRGKGNLLYNSRSD